MEKIDIIKQICIGKSKNKNIVKYSSSGGIVSSILIDLFEKQEIDAAIVAYFDKNLNVYGDIITSTDDVRNHSGSYYQTAKMLVNINKIKKYRSVAFVGLPCHNIALKKYIDNYKITNINFSISLFCSIGRLKNGMIEYLKDNRYIVDELSNVNYYVSRFGEEKPGKIIIKIGDKQIIFDYMNYLQSMDYLYIPEGCLNCKKLFGIEYSDISVGDNWGIKTNEKIAIFAVNSQKGIKLIKNNDLIDMRESNIGELIKSQPLGYGLKYKNRSKVNFKIRILKRLYTILPKNYVTKKILLKYRSFILKHI